MGDLSGYLLLFLILVSGGIMPVSATGNAEGVAVQLVPEYFGPDSWFSGLNNDSVLYLNIYNESSRGTGCGLYLYSISENRTYPVASGNQETCEHIVGNLYLGRHVSGDRVVWGDSMPAEISLFEKNTGKNRIIPNMSTRGSGKSYSLRFGDATITETSRCNPVIDGDRVVFQQGFFCSTDHPTLDLYLLNLTSNEMKPVSEAPAAQQYPSLSGKYVVWEDNRNGKDNPDVFMYNLVTGEETAVCTNSSIQRAPVVSGDYVAWLDFRHGSGTGQIYLYSIPTGSVTEITSGSMNHGEPFISGDRIAYSECIPYLVDPRGLCHAAIYDIRTKTVRKIPGKTENQIVRGFSGNRILYTEETDAVRELYLFTLEDEALTAVTKPQDQVDPNSKPGENQTSITSENTPETTPSAPGFDNSLVTVMFFGLVALAVMKKNG